MFSLPAVTVWAGTTMYSLVCLSSAMYRAEDEVRERESDLY